MRPKVINSDAVDKTVPRRSPAEIIIESLEGQYETMKTMAARYGVHKETMRRICSSTWGDGTPRLKAPSRAVQQGGLAIYLFDADDVKEVDEYMEDRGYLVIEKELNGD